MSNIINSNFNNLKLKLNTDEYWDFFISQDVVSRSATLFNGQSLNDKCLISYIDTTIPTCINGTFLQSTSDYYWPYINVSPHQMNNIAWCGIDNGTISFRRDLNNNKSFIDLLTHTNLKIDETDTFLKLHQVSGGTNLYEYPISIENQLVKLNGGFYQGFFKTTCDKYQILPSSLDNGESWHFEFTLKKEDFKSESSKTLNDKYPQNKGIFFYIGTRSENKWIYSYDDSDECLTLGVDEYIENGEISKKDYIIKDLIDANPDMPILWEEFATYNYINDKYYAPSVYGDMPLTQNDLAFDDYLLENFKPSCINEKTNKSITIYNCCLQKINQSTLDTFYSSDHDFLVTDKDISTINVCETFGDDFLLDVGDLDYDTEFIEKDLDLSDFVYETDGGINLLINQKVIDSDNKFLLFDRTCNGYNVHTWQEGTIGRFIQNKSSFNENLFLLMNRTCTGYTVHTIDKLRETYKKEYNIYNDLYNNALAFRITDDGAIGYRYLTIGCDEQETYKIEEGYSHPNIIKEKEWVIINVKLTHLLNKMILKFYVNGNLIYVSKELPILNLRSLNEEQEKQEGIPYNISIGGGTQGLADTIIIYNYMLDPYRIYPLEKHFGGSFIGYFKSFKFFNCSQESLIIKNNFNFENNKVEEI